MPRGRKKKIVVEGEEGRVVQPNPIDQHVGIRIRVRRKVLKLSQEELAEKLGLTFQQVQKYERGFNRVSASRLYDIAQILGMPISFFFEDMPRDVMDNSPRVRAGLADNVETESAESDPMSRRETLELVRNYYQIKDPKMRKIVFELIKNIIKGNFVPFHKRGDDNIDNIEI